MERLADKMPSLDPASWTLEALDEELERIRADIRSRLAHLSVVKGMTLGVSAPPSARRSLWNAVAVNLHDISPAYLYSIPSGAASCYHKLALSLLDRGNPEGAAEAVARALSLNPFDKDAWAVSGTIARLAGARIAKQHERLYRLKHVRTFGRSRLKLPVSAAVIAGRGLLAVSDHHASSVHVFDLDGRFKRSLELHLELPGGLEDAGNGTVWICDKNHRRLVRFDPENGFLQEQPVAAADPELGAVHPGHLRKLDDGRFACLAANHDFSRNLVGTLDSDGFRPFSGIQGTPSSLRVANGVILTRDYYTGAISRFDASGRPVPSSPSCQPRIAQNFSFAMCGAELYADSGGKNLARFDGDGNMVFFAPLAGILGDKVQIFHIEPSSRKGRRILYLVDGGNRCVHIFETERVDEDGGVAS